MGVAVMVTGTGWPVGSVTRPLIVAVIVILTV